MELTLEQKRALALANARLRVQQAPPPPKDKSALDYIKDVAGAAIEPNLALMSGAVATPLAGIAGLVSAGANALGSDSFGKPDEVVRNVQSKLTYQPGTEAGKDALGYIAYPFEKLAEGADYLGGKATDLTGSPAIGAAVNTAVNVLPSAVGGVAGIARGGPSTIGGVLDAGSRKLMQSALKPTSKDMALGKGDRAITTLLDEGMLVNKGSEAKLGQMADAINKQVADIIANSNGTVSRADALRQLTGSYNRAYNQVAPDAHVAAVRRVEDQFLNHPAIAGNDIPVQQAQRLKQGTYQNLKDSYGQLSMGEEAAQKDLARGLRLGIEQAEPAVAPLNARAGDLMNARNVLSRRNDVSGNSNIGGLAALASSNPGVLAFLLDKWDWSKSLGARTMRPGKNGLLNDEAVAAGSMPRSFDDDTQARKALIDALLNMQGN